jgi:hypothetical protein
MASSISEPLRYVARFAPPWWGLVTKGLDLLRHTSSDNQSRCFNALDFSNSMWFGADVASRSS